MTNVAESMQHRGLSDEADHVILLRNPIAGSGVIGGLINDLIGTLDARGFKVEVVTDLCQLPAVAGQLLREGRLRTVVSAGGDGTAETAVNLMPADAPLTVFPLGTENLLAKYLGMDCNVTAVGDAVQFGRVVRMDAGAIRISKEHESRLFLLMMGCGFDAEVIRRLHRARTGNITHLAYARPILEAIRSYDYPPIKVTCHEHAEGPAIRTIQAHWAFVFNTPSYAVGLGICPDANPFDAKLDLVTFRGGSFLQGLLHLGSVLVGRHRQRRSVQTVRVTCVRISAERSVPVQLDGDPWEELPVEVMVQPGRLTAIVPREWTNPCQIR